MPFGPRAGEYVARLEVGGGLATPTQAAGMGCLGALIRAAAYRRLNLRVLQDVIRSAGVTSAVVFFIIIGATLFASVFRALGGDDVVEDILAASGIDTAWEILILVFIMGFFFDFIEIALIVISIFYPLLLRADFGEHVGPAFWAMPWATILIAVNLQTSLPTPPFGFSPFDMRGVVTVAVRMQHVYRGIIPFVLLQLTAVGLVMAFLQIALWLPRARGFLE